MKTVFQTAMLLLLLVAPSLAWVSVSANASGSASPITISGTASTNYSITGWTIYVDSSLVFRQNTSSKSISQAISMSSGTHKVVVKAWDSSGANGGTSLSVTVSTSSSSLIPKPPSTAKYLNSIDQMSGWVACSKCANNTSATSYWYKQWVGSPSLDGASMQTYIKGSWNAWADDLFVKTFGDQTWARNIEFTMHFLWNAPKVKQANGAYVVQAIEFDSRMLIGDFKYLFGTQCNYGHGTWDIWNNTSRYWYHTSIPCQKWGPNSWHTVTWYFTIDNTHKYLHYVALAVDGKQYSVNKAMAAGSVPYNKQFLIQFEQDTDQAGDPWYLWADKIQAVLW